VTLVKWVGGPHIQWFNGIRQDEPQGMKVSPWGRAVLAAAVRKVSHNGVAKMSTVNTKLVSTASNWAEDHFGRWVVEEHPPLEDKEFCLS